MIASNSSKKGILGRLAKQSVADVPLPSALDGAWIEYADPVAQFAEMVKLVGGSCQSLASLDVLPEQLNQYPQWREAKQVFSAVEQIPSTAQLNECMDPHELEKLDFVVYPAAFGVAENGAVWITDHNLKHRVVLFITQYLVLIVRRDQIVNTMHQAYALAVPPRPGFGLFLAGPSKTADIEQSLVIGAHGCRELQVYIV